MDIVKAYKCSHCGKIYDNASSCRSHEYRCCFNPATKSCASCAFLKLERTRHPVQDGVNIEFQACLVNNMVSGRLKTRCDKYMNNTYRDDEEIMNEVYRDYKFDEQLFNYCERVRYE